MSYILDAIKKAEAERNLGAVPNIHAHPAFHSSEDYKAPFWKGPLLWISLTAFLAILLATMWLRSEQRAPAAIAAPPMQTKPIPTPAPAPAPAVQVEAPLVAQAESGDPALAATEDPIDIEHAAERPARRVTPARPTRGRIAEPAVARPPVSAVNSPAPAAPLAAVSPRALTLPPAAAATATTAAAAATAPALNELPEHIQREVPPLITGGYIYTNNPATRSVLINGKLLHEGDQVAPDLILEKLTPKGAILNFKGYRYRSGY